MNLALQTEKHFLFNLPVVVLAKVVQDIRYKLGQELEVAEPCFSQSERLNSDSIGIIVFDEELRCVYIDETLMKVSQVTATVLIGEPLHLVMSNLLESLEDILRKVMITGNSIANYPLTIKENTSTRFQEQWLASFHPLFIQESNVTHTVGVLISVKKG